MLVYIHFPFCRSKCGYCAFHSVPVIGDQEKDSAMFQSYLDSLFLEIAHYGDVYKDRTIESVFIGGGTPSLLPASILGSIVEKIGGTFRMAPKTEITLEANPESLKGKNLGDYLKSGINRLSIGLQSLDDALLRTLGRAHRAIDGINAVNMAKEAGFTNISVDLMWGLPGQGVRNWLQTLKDVIKLAPDHISTYNLTLEPGTPIEQACEKGTLILPPERDQSLMYLEGSSLLEANGFLHYEISNFARMGYQCRHNTGYWEGAEYLGLGPSSTSTFGSKRWTNPADISAWEDKIRKGTLGQSAELLTPKVKLLEFIMLRLRTALGMQLKTYEEMTGRDFLQDNQKFIQTLHENGLARIRNGYLSLTNKGMLVSNTIISNLFDRIAENPAIDSIVAGGKPPVPNSNPVTPAPHAIPVSWPFA